MAEGGMRTWTEIEWIVLHPEGRASAVPPETRATPYVARSRGMATSAEVGQEAEIETATGRRLRGRVRELMPGHHHTFGNPLPEWIAMRDSIRGIAMELSRQDTRSEGHRGNDEH
jgi:2-amino-4-ketopentanoate thiolase alpha subunit